MAGLTRTKKQKGNIFKRYFSDFGLKQVADMLIIAGIIVLIIGLFLYKQFETINILALIGASVYALGAIFRLITVIAVFKEVKNKRAPQYKQALINLVIVSALLLLAVAVIVLSIVLPVVPN